MGLEHTEIDFVPYSVGPIPPGPWLVFAAHADDETLGMGGMLLLAGRERLDVHLVVLTDGAAGAEDAEAMAAIREQEVLRIAQHLELASVTFWRQPDRHLEPSPRLTRKVADSVQRTAAAAVFFPSIMEYHPDHRAAAVLVWQGLEQVGYAGVRCAYEISCQARVNRLVDISAVWEEKHALIGFYASQLGQNNYRAVAKALNLSRTFSLPASVVAAEGLYVYRQGAGLNAPVEELADICTPAPARRSLWHWLARHCLWPGNRRRA